MPLTHVCIARVAVINLVRCINIILTGFPYVHLSYMGNRIRTGLNPVTVTYMTLSDTPFLPNSLPVIGGKQNTNYNILKVLRWYVLNQT